ncbi:glucan 1,4-alpha-glucosidase [Brevundimonas sp. LM2]|nr:glucan 1,4-alpha-glucosidase [Brevundimonas sp. LM2]
MTLTGGPALAQAWAGGAATPRETPPYQDLSLSAQVRAADLVSRLTLEEKAAQLVNDATAVPRLGIREYNWWNEGLHGVAGAGEATVFPQAIGMAATWNAPLIGQVAEIISTEFRAKHVESRHRFGGSDWFAGLTVWSPNINIFRDPRWGRGQETYGEDPHLTSRLGVAFVRGLEVTEGDYVRTIATPKHYAVHSGPEPSRHRDNILPSARDLHETYLPAFRATIMEGGAGSIMCAYNAIDGAPACANAPLLRDVLRRDWGFQGYVVSDCDAVANIYRAHEHGYTETPEQGVAVAFRAGMDLICGGPEESVHILGAIRQGLMTEAELDVALERLFTARFRLGQFDPPAQVFPAITPADNDTEAHRAVALRVAEESLVLLRNQDGLLPLKAAPRRIAVIGPNGDSVEPLVGNYNGSPSHPVTLADGLRRRFPEAQVTVVEGSGLIDPALAPVPEALLCVDRACAAPGLTATRFASATMEGDPVSTGVSANAAERWQGEQRSGATRWTGFLTPTESGEHRFRYVANGGYRIWIDDALVVDAWNVDWRPAIATGAASLEAGRAYAIRVEAFQRQDQGDERLMWSTPADAGLQAAVAAARDAEVVIFAAGLTHEVEGEEMRVQVPGFLGGDRTRIDLPAAQQRLLEAVTATGTPVVLVLMNGSALSVEWADRTLPAIVEAWYPGGQGGDAIARLIAGDFSPAGRLPVTVYRSVEDLPAFGDYGMDNRTYRYFRGEPLYPFGYGLSYSSFAYAAPRVSDTTVRPDQAVTVSVDVTNTGAMAADEVVQLYLSHPGVPDAPIRTLAGFERVHLAQGETRRVRFTLDPRALSLVGADGVRRVAPGPVSVWVGGGQPGTRPGLTPAAGARTELRLTGGAMLPN